jgi:hypothetical protein
MKSKYILFYNILLLFVYGCSSYSIDNHFRIETNKTSDDTELVYIDDQGFGFTVIDKKVFAYQKCVSKLFVKQHPSTEQDTIDVNTTNYYVVDINKNYSNERSKPLDTSVEHFNEELSKCGNADFVEF